LPEEERVLADLGYADAGAIFTFLPETSIEVLQHFLPHPHPTI
jgi:hypothetical protein